MSHLVDLFGYLSVVVHGLVIVAQSMTVGGTLFLVTVARPFASRVPDGTAIVRRAARIAGWSALALVACEALTVAMQGAVLANQVGIGLWDVLGATFATAGLVKIAAALILAVLLFSGWRVPAALLLLPGAVIIGAAVMTTHATARLDDRRILILATTLHILGAAIWIGGIPCFVMALARLRDGPSLCLVSARFSRMSMIGVGCILASAAVFSVLYIGSWQAVYGTAYGVMVSAKTIMFVALLLLGLGNFLVVQRLGRDPSTPVLRLRRFAEVEIGIGLSVFFAAASLTSVPPAVDLTQDRVTWAEIAAHNAPEWPRLVSPDHDALALPALQAKLDRQAARDHTTVAPAFVPGSSVLPPRNAADVAWSEYNHHWAGIFVLLIGILALLSRAGVRWAKHWPLMFLGLAVFMFLRSDPEVWPLGQEGLFASLRDIEVLQHRVFVLLVIAFALFEWGVRTGRLHNARAALVFPMLTAVGGALLLTHNHALANVREQLLIEQSHTPLALAGIAAGWARWLELRADGRVARISGWIWPICFLLIGLILLWYRET